eukprot:TRINITY_DN9846_c0_g1_i2.p1 TRINITY_DN9846_c0_g1~~TRINITY_DN9846_c0_g1_i2.p1  ORF type:complete len:203 (-),score=34.64 TRINITY_DN9846_c0_g1_i2:83-691(-)
MFLQWIFVNLTLLALSIGFTLGFTDFFDLTAIDISGREVKFSDLEGKAVLVVNVASQCGFTDGHYKGLKRLHDILAFNHKLAILAFPCNQFGSQEPGDDDEIRDVAHNVYGVEFPVFQKCDVHGPNAHSVWKFLTETSGITPDWNFYKYLLDHHGNIIQAWPPRTPIEDIFDAVERAVEDADGEAQMESPLASHEFGSHDEL